MEKKGSRSVQSSSKGLATDIKKTQDVNKLWPRSSRRREPNGGSFPKNETSRKPTPQRNKTADKRPKPRGYYYSGATGGTQDTGLELQEAELGSVFVQGSKKQSLNHLINFHFEPRERQWQSGLNGPKSGHRWNSSVKHKYNKEQFLQANCQFIVKESGDYKMYMNNPDALVNWDLIEQVNIHVLEFPSCPICLYPPVAAKMTRCGHIYCWSCVLHYLALSDKSWRKCPICYEAVHKTDLKSVRAIPHSTFNTKEMITFKLMRRARGSLITYPAELSIQETDVPFKLSEDIAKATYTKLLIADQLEVMSVIEREKLELLEQLAEDENCPEKCFIEQALALLKERGDSLFLQTNTSDAVASAPTSTETPINNDNNRERYESISSDNLGSDDLNSTNEIIVEDLEISSGSCQKPSKYFYFYQACDGQHIYLHALNARMLEHTYGSLESCPKTITGCIVEKESASMTEAIRKRLRYLQHLPVTCQFEVAEIQLKPPIVSKETLDHFAEQIETRQRRRQRRARDEKRREKRITEEENKKMGKYAPANIKIESHYQFPEFQSEPIQIHPPNIGQHSPTSERSLSPSDGISNLSVGSSAARSFGTDNESSGLSFAKMLSSNKASTSAWPARKSLQTSNDTISAKVKKHLEVNFNEPDAEGYIPVPAFNQSFGDAIALAFEKATIENDDEREEKNGKKKKKKKQKKILFATSMACSGN